MIFICLSFNVISFTAAFLTLLQEDAIYRAIEKFLRGGTKRRIVALLLALVLLRRNFPIIL
jgi:hypothetical protein